MLLREADSGWVDRTNTAIRVAAISWTAAVLAEAATVYTLW